MNFAIGIFGECPMTLVTLSILLCCKSATKMYFYCKVVKTQFLIESTDFLN
jgi:hypothetical protein